MWQHIYTYYKTHLKSPLSILYTVMAIGDSNSIHKYTKLSPRGTGYMGLKEVIFC